MSDYICALCGKTDKEQGSWTTGPDGKRYCWGDCSEKAIGEDAVSIQDTIVRSVLICPNCGIRRIYNEAPDENGVCDCGAVWSYNGDDNLFEFRWMKEQPG